MKPCKLGIAFRIKNGPELHRAACELMRGHPTDHVGDSDLLRVQWSRKDSGRNGGRSTITGVWDRSKQATA